MPTSYISEYTHFMNEFLKNNPSVAEDQVRSRGLLWDVQLEKEEQAGFDASKLTPSGYAYPSK